MVKNILWIFPFPQAAGRPIRSRNSLWENERRCLVIPRFIDTYKTQRPILKKLITRLMAPLRKSNDGEDENVSALWEEAHSHLRPHEPQLPLPESSYHECPLCQARRAVRIRARLRFGADYWQDDASLLYCYQCGGYALTRGESKENAARAQAWALENRPGAVASYASLTALDARLWSRTPKFLNLEPTTRCNFNCWYCIGRHMKQDDIDFDGFVRALENFPGLEVLALVGEGEPLLHKRFFDMVRLAKEKGIRVATISNGSAFSESVVRKICESGVDYISISIDSTDPETFAASRLDGDLPKVWQGIERLTAYRDANNYKYPQVGLKGTLFTHTRDEMPAIAEEAKRRGMDVIESFQPLNAKRSYIKIYPADKLDLLNDAPEIAATINEGYASVPLPSVAEFAQRENLPISNIGKRNGLRPNCDEEWIYSLLSGDVTPCCQIKQPMDAKWNIFNHSIDEILVNPQYENLRFNLWNGIFLKTCEGCSKTN